jgi:hypothetical protein
MRRMIAHPVKRLIFESELLLCFLLIPILCQDHFECEIADFNPNLASCLFRSEFRIPLCKLVHEDRHQSGLSWRRLSQVPNSVKHEHYGAKYNAVYPKSCKFMALDVTDKPRDNH